MPLSKPLPRRRLNTAEIEQIIAGYRTGATTRQLATEYGVNRHTVAKCLRAAGVHVYCDPLTKEQITEAIRLYQQGWSLARVGDHLGREPTVIWHVLKRAGIPRRDPHGRERPS